MVKILKMLFIFLCNKLSGIFFIILTFQYKYSFKKSSKRSVSVTIGHILYLCRMQNCNQNNFYVLFWQSESDYKRRWFSLNTRTETRWNAMMHKQTFAVLCWCIGCWRHVKIKKSDNHSAFFTLINLHQNRTFGTCGVTSLPHSSNDDTRHSL